MATGTYLRALIKIPVWWRRAVRCFSFFFFPCTPTRPPGPRPWQAVYRESLPETGTVAPPTVQAALLGSVAQIATLSAVWLRYTSVASCVPDPRGCWHDPWQVLITLTICLSLWLLSLRTIRSKGTSDPSIVDRLWSILPWLYCWHWYGSAPTPRGLLLATLASIWGLRLTANFARKGGFSGGEDYRWAEIRTWPGFDRGWEVFNLLFICGCRAALARYPRVAASPTASHTASLLHQSSVTPLPSPRKLGDATLAGDTASHPRPR